MRRSSLYHPLQWVVQVHGHMGCLAWETIAAFNAEQIAVEYRNKCQLSAKRYGYGSTYRVMVRRSRGIWDTVG